MKYQLVDLANSSKDWSMDAVRESYDKQSRAKRQAKQDARVAAGQPRFSGGPEDEDSHHIREVHSNHVIVSKGYGDSAEHAKVPYDVQADGTFKFGKHEPVKHAYVPVSGKKDVALAVRAGLTDIELGKDGSRWAHGYIPENAAAVALKAHKSPSASGAATPGAVKVHKVDYHDKHGERASVSMRAKDGPDAIKRAKAFDPGSTRHKVVSTEGFRSAAPGAHDPSAPTGPGDGGAALRASTAKQVAAAHARFDAGKVTPKLDPGSLSSVIAGRSIATARPGALNPSSQELLARARAMHGTDLSKWSKGNLKSAAKLGDVAAKAELAKRTTKKK